MNKVAPFRIKFVFLNVDGTTPSYKDFQNSLSYLERVYPVNTFDYTYGEMDVKHNVNTKEGYNDTLRDLFKYRFFYFPMGKDRVVDRHFIGLFDNTISTYYAGMAHCPGYVAIAKAMSEHEYNNGQNLALTVPHELGHNLGRKHVNCPYGVPGDIDPNYPYDPCRLSYYTSHEDYGYYGFDIQEKKFIAPSIPQIL